MCGIVGYIGFNQASDFLLDGMAKLEYRGYDSAGIAVIGAENAIKIQKKVGRLANLEAIVKADPNEGTVGIGHTRWATHGRPSDMKPILMHLKMVNLLLFTTVSLKTTCL